MINLSIIYNEYETLNMGYVYLIKILKFNIDITDAWVYSVCSQ